jgi:3-methyladenine DNA glycosylase AlkC
MSKAKPKNRRESKRLSTKAASTDHPLAARIGARRISEIPANVLVALNSGELATVNLVEALAVDMPILARSVFDRLGRVDLADRVGAAADELAPLGVLKRLVGIGGAIYGSLAKDRRRKAVFEQVATHPSDTVRSWACFAIQADTSLTLADRLTATRRFAADPHFGVRECAWMSARPFFAANLDEAIERLLPWTHDADANIRRFAIESTRPRGVWCAHLTALKEEPRMAAGLLEVVRSDSSRYVQASVANWLNDAAKFRPKWVQQLCRRWQKESPTVETAWIVKRGLRSIKECPTASPLPAGG